MQEKKLTGFVVSDKTAKTRILSTSSTYRMKKYEKVVRMTHKHMFHDEKNESRAGDRVEIEFSRPLSARKRWKLSRIIESSKDRI